jgi:hypothetical protein
METNLYLVVMLYMIDFEIEHSFSFQEEPTTRPKQSQSLIRFFLKKECFEMIYKLLNNNSNNSNNNNNHSNNNNNFHPTLLHTMALPTMQVLPPQVLTPII